MQLKSAKSKPLQIYHYKMKNNKTNDEWYDKIR